MASDARVATPDVLDSLAGAIRFRGRDAEGRWSSDQVHLLHSRLAVIDPEGGSQPMVDRSGRFVITFGGEVHNHVELRRRLESMGARFRTASDTEVVLEGYRLLGPAICDELVGMFSFAIWDADERHLFLARDRLGEKPLYWFAHGDAVWFASSCLAFRACPGWTGNLSERGLAEYAAGGSCRGSTTIFDGVQALLPGSYAIVRPGDATVRSTRWWQLRFGRVVGRDDELVEAYEAALTEAIRIRLRSDVPIALTFSGGVDSGSIAALAVRRLDVALRCVTLDHHTETNQSEETLRAQQVAETLGLPWHFEHYEYEHSFLTELDAAYAFFDQPSWQPELAQVARVAQVIAGSATVALTGSGADELLLGYRGDERLRSVDLVAAAARGARLPRFVTRHLDPMPHLVARLRAGVDGVAPELQPALEPALDELAADARESGVVGAADLKLLHTLTWGAVESMYRVPDVAGLAAGVEMRSPFLDHRLVELAATLPARVKVRRPWTPRTNKWIARLTYERYVGSIAWASKLNMGSNARWDVDLARSDEWRVRVEAAIDRVGALGLDVSAARASYRRYVNDLGGPTPTYAPTVRALMLGMWLERNSAALLSSR